MPDFSQRSAIDIFWKPTWNLVKVIVQEPIQLNHVSGATFCSCQCPAPQEGREALGKRVYLNMPIHPSLEHSPQGFAGVSLND